MVITFPSLSAKVEFGYFVLAMVAKAFESSTMEGKYCRVCTIVMQTLVGLAFWVTIIFFMCIVKVDSLFHSLV